MRESSSNLSKQNSQQPKDIRGGEKKVMKKSLSAIVSLAMAFSMFSSVAFGAEATTTTSATTTATATAAKKTVADFKDLADIDAGLKAKIEALLAKGVFEGTSEDSFGIKENMTRAQFAKVLTLIYGVEVDMNVKASSFSDVKADDNANAWAIPFIEAAKKKGLIDGMTDSTFAPGENVTLGQFATALVKGLGKTVSTTGTPWYSDAIKQAVELKVLPEGVDGAKTATRADLVVGAYGGQEAFAALQGVTVNAKATNYNKVTINFGTAVDTTKAVIELTKDGIKIAHTAKFSEDKKSVDLTTEGRITAGTYKVTVSGLTEKAIEKEFTAEDEKIAKIDFVTAGDTIAQGEAVKVKVKATNQYGEFASFSAGSYSSPSTGTYGVRKISKDQDGYLIVEIDSNDTAIPVGVGMVTVTLISNENNNPVTATKTFKVGTPAILTKLELGAAKYSVGSSLSGQGENVKFALNFFDQYGSMMNYADVTSGSNKTLVIWNDFVQQGTIADVVEDVDGNPVLKLSLTKNLDKSGDYNFTVINSAASATGKISVKSSKVATKIQIGALDDVIAAGDTEAFVPVIAYDAQGNLLSPEDLVSNENLARIKLSGNGFSTSTAQLYQYGENKGKIRLDKIPNERTGVVSVTAFIAEANVTSNATKNFNVSAARYPDRIKEVTAPGAELVAGGFSKFKYQVLDQYGKVLDTLKQVDSQGNVVTSGGSTYSVTVSANTYAPVYDSNGNVTYGTTPIDVDADSRFGTANTTEAKDGTALSVTPLLVTKDSDTDNNAVIDEGPTAIGNLKGWFNNKTYRFFAANNASAKDHKLEFVASILKNDGTRTTEVHKVSKTVTVKDVAVGKNELTYSLNTVATLWNAKDSEVVVDAVYGPAGAANLNSNPRVDTDVLRASVQLAANSKFGREIVVAAKNAAGETVGIPKTVVSVSSSDTNVANVLATGGKAYVIGNKAGTAKVAVSFTAADGSLKTLSTDVTVKSDALSVASVTWDEKAWYEGLSFNAFEGLNVKDNYGVTFENGDARKYNYALGVTFAVSNIKTSDGTTAQVGINAYGDVTVTLAPTATAATEVVFDLTATSATGKSATTSIYAKTGNTRTVK
jgi:trimeric autotransporter adhesin